LSFDGVTHTFMGTPDNADVATLAVTVKAIDAAGAFGSDSFILTVQNSNDAPVQTPGQHIAQQTAERDIPFRYTVSAELFSDPDQQVDPQAALRWQATLLDGTDLSSADSTFWLHFDPDSRTFSGVPGSGDSGMLTVMVRVSDQGLPALSAAVPMLLTIASSNHAPLAHELTFAGAAYEEQPFRFALPDDLFWDEDAGDALQWSATQADGTALPSWLHFDSDTHLFYGTPDNPDVGTCRLAVTARDPQQATATVHFALAVNNRNDVPQWHTVPDTLLLAGESFQFRLGAESVTDPDYGDLLTLEAVPLGSTTQGADWLHFDEGSATFSGVAPVGDGDFFVRLTATDLAGAATSTLLHLGVRSSLEQDPPLLRHASASATAVLLTFNEPVNAAQGSIVVQDEEGNSQSMAVEDARYVHIAGQTVTITTPLPLQDGVRYAVQLPGGVVQDWAGNPFAGVSDGAALLLTVPEQGATVESARAMAVGEMVVGRINGADDADWYAITLPGGMVATIDVQGAPSGVGTLTDPYLMLRDVAGNLLVYDDDAGVGYESQLHFISQESATYLLDVSAWDGATGSYRLQVQLAPDENTPELLRSLTFAETVVLTFSEPVAALGGSILLTDGQTELTFALDDAQQVTLQRESITDPDGCLAGADCRGRAAGLCRTWTRCRARCCGARCGRQCRHGRSVSSGECAARHDQSGL
jgi:methionine-rich copper-binding protein CopC